MVRLKVTRHDSIEVFIYSFNSTMVRLKAEYCLRSISALTTFQFHNGSIKRRESSSDIYLIHKFQFHNGSIKSLILIALSTLILLFQFHNGSIKRTLNPQPNGDLTSFNSTMVRLKVAFDGSDVLALTGFQFHNGSIKSCWYLGHAHCGDEFQFHNGSIKSLPPTTGIGGYEQFQFHNGSIKRRRARCPSRPARPGFNSTMVRLKVGVYADTPEYRTRVSIPQWFD